MKINVGLVEHDDAGVSQAVKVKETLKEDLEAIARPHDLFPGLSHFVTVVDIDSAVAQLGLTKRNLWQPLVEEFLEFSPIASGHLAAMT